MKTPTTYEEIATYIEKGKNVFFFTADWCGDCRFIEPFLPEIVAMFPEWTFSKIDTSQWSSLAEQWQISGIPSLILIKDGKEKARLVNKQRKTKEEIIEFLTRRT